jgi:hypothetical protein
MVISLNLDDNYRSRKLQAATKAGSDPLEKKETKEKKKEEDTE